MRRLAPLFAFAAVSALSLSTASAAAENYDVDAVHSAVLFRCQHFNAGFTWGRFDTFSGTFTVDDARPEASSVKVSIDATSIDTNQKQRDDDLRSPNFLDVAKYPMITFESTAVRKTGDKAYEVTGNLTLHGTTKSVSFAMQQTGAADDKWGKHRMGFEGVVSVKRSEYGVSGLPGGVGEEVRLTLAIEGVRK